MTTATKAKNGRIAADLTKDMNKATQEARLMMDNFAEALKKTSEDTRALLDAQQRIWRAGFDLWQQAGQSYFNFATDIMQQVFEQSLAQRKQISRVMQDNFKKTQDVVWTEQAFTLETTKTFQTQMQGVSERLAELFSAPISTN
jgi:hypothetical protein